MINLIKRLIEFAITISWTGPSSFDIIFSGIEKGCVVAVSTVGIRFAKFDFLLGYNQMLKVINMSKIICVGKPYKEMTGDIVYIQYKRDAKVLSLICNSIPATFCESFSF